MQWAVILAVLCKWFLMYVDGGCDCGFPQDRHKRSVAAGRETFSKVIRQEAKWDRERERERERGTGSGKDHEPGLKLGSPEAH
ncbi:hypothetical protein DPX16_5346 [Anabarilius grahami]|uniref:Secreted protein n=1 Tax=Anabarilius grahami TaxID=495550 RepID=A0A3N0YD53_ANAGA|nr:hypothetical protein DPX16_5346 [Anabarilius grahami]